MLNPITFEQQLTSAELAFVETVADHTYTNGQLIIGNGSTGAVLISTLTAGSGVTITNGPGTITIAVASGGTGMNPQAPVGTINSSNVTFTCTGTVHVAFADGQLDSSAAITGATNSTIVYSVPPQNNVYAI